MNLIQRFDALVVKVIAFFVASPAKQETLHQFVKFGMIGVFNTVVDFGIYYVLTRYTGFFNVETSMKYVANTISFVTATTFSFFANRSWSFKQTHKANFNEAVKFYTTTLSSLCINVGLFALLVYLFSLHDIVAKIFATVVTTCWNFILTKLWVFAPKRT